MSKGFLIRILSTSCGCMRFFVGTSGYSFKEWKGNFYPEKLPQKAMLSYYAQRFSTVEINNTFHKFPSEGVVQAWADQVPDSFRFVLKERQGPILFQLPPNFKKDVPRLDAFLRFIAGRSKLAFEFRHASWFDDEVFDCLRTHSTGLCVADTDELPG